MNLIMKNDLASMLADGLDLLVEKYRLRIIPIDNAEALVVGPSYALRFSAGQEGLDDIVYIERDSRDKLAAYSLRKVEMERLTKEDRALYGNPSTVKERWVASVAVVSSAFKNSWHDVLIGDKSWLKRDRWRVENPSSVIEKALKDDFVSP